MNDVQELGVVNPEVIHYGTFRITAERGNRFWKILQIGGPVSQYNDSQLLLWAGGSEYHGSRVERYGSDHATLYCYED